MPALHSIHPCLWFDYDKAEEAANFYVSIFPKSRIKRIQRYGDEGREITGGTPGNVMVVDFELEGQPFTALAGGPLFKFSEAISFQVMCETQKEIDDYTAKLSAGGTGEQQCGWLKDRFGLSWQIVPAIMADLLADKDPARAGRVMKAMLQMKKLDIAKLKDAARG